MSRIWLARLRQAVSGLGGGLPGVCAICAGWPAQTFCSACLERFAQPVPRCSCCALLLPTGIANAPAVCAACRLQPPPLDRCLAAVGWNWPWRDFIARFKYGHDPGWAGPLARLLGAAPEVQALLREIDLLLPLPLARPRLRERGFNQSLELARQLAPHKTEAALLLRIRDTPPQASLTRAARLRNLHGAFGVDPARTDLLRGRHVALLDDVMTTGSTLYEAAAVLRAAGAARVSALVLARSDELQPASVARRA